MKDDLLYAQVESTNISARVYEGSGDEAKTAARCSDEKVTLIYFDHVLVVDQDDFGWFVCPVDSENRSL